MSRQDLSTDPLDFMPYPPTKVYHVPTRREGVVFYWDRADHNLSHRVIYDDGACEWAKRTDLRFVLDADGKTQPSKLALSGNAEHTYTDSKGKDWEVIIGVGDSIAIKPAGSSALNNYLMRMPTYDTYTTGRSWRWRGKDGKVVEHKWPEVTMAQAVRLYIEGVLA
jgi:hypothetical protein